MTANFHYSGEGKGGLQGSGRCHSQAATQTMEVMAIPTTHGRVPVANSTMPLSAISSVALHLARRLTLPPWAQLRSRGPNKRWFHSQR